MAASRCGAVSPQQGLGLVLGEGGIDDYKHWQLIERDTVPVLLKMEESRALTPNTNLV